MLEVTHISKCFGGVKAVLDVSFSIAPGNILACVGPNAAGKTTLLNVISGWHRPDKGSVKINGQVIESFTPEVFASHGVVRTFQRAKLFRNQSVIANLLFASRQRSEETLRAAILRTKWLRRQDQECSRAQKILADLGISELCHRPAHFLSGGEQRLVELAIAGMRHPKILVLDEPAANLSEESRNRIAGFLLKQKEAGVSCILVEHDLRFVEKVADQLLVLSCGRLVGVGEPSSSSTQSLLKHSNSAASSMAIDATSIINSSPDVKDYSVSASKRRRVYKTVTGRSRSELLISTPSIANSSVRAFKIWDRSRRRGSFSVQGGWEKSRHYESLAVRGLTVDYGNGPVIHDITLKVNPGEIVALIGGNGAGKSTTIRAILGLLRYRGSVKLGNTSLTSMLPDAISRLGVSYVAQHRKVFPNLTVLENLLISPKSRGNKKGDGLEPALRVFPELSDFLNMPAGILSGGQQQMVAIGKAVLAKPRLLLLDEPSAGLSENLWSRLTEILNDLVQEGLPVLIVEHRSVAQGDIATRRYFLKQGFISHSS